MKKNTHLYKSIALRGHCSPLPLPEPQERYDVDVSCDIYSSDDHSSDVVDNE